MEYPQPSPILQEMIEESDLAFIQEDFLQLLESMRMGTQRIRDIVISLRNFSRLDEADIKAVDIHEGIDSTLIILSHRLRERADQKLIKIVKYYHLLTAVECYPSQLNQVVMNILANAIDVLGDVPEPEIIISTHACDERAIINITDNGPGMPATVRDHIFDPFFTTKPIGKGTGMGLSICHQIVTEKHGGTLSVSPAPEGGTQFTVDIPLKQVSPRQGPRQT
ncbi:MAG: ATP-binding protein [Cyanobacteria bacterium J06559_1]